MDTIGLTLHIRRRGKQMNAREKLEKARVQLLIDNPFFATPLLPITLEEDNSEPTLATDGIKLFYNTSFVENLSLKEVITVNIHEAWHILLLQNLRRFDRNPEVWNLACDYQVNCLIRKAGYTWIDGMLYDNKYEGLSADEIYETLKRENKPQPNNSKRIGDIKDFPKEMLGKKTIEEKITETKEALSTSSKLAEKAGKMSKEDSKVVQDILQPKIPWQSLLNEWLSETVKDDYSWMIRNKRNQEYYLPGMFSETIGPVVVAIDTSGSVYGQKDLLDTFFSELRGLQQVFNTTYIVMCVDDEVKRVDRFEPHQKIEAHIVGGGGTRFSPTFKYIKEHIREEISGVVYFTDMYCNDFGENPPYRVLWMNYGKRNAQPPFGQVVNLYN